MDYQDGMSVVQYAELHPFAYPKIGGSEELGPEPISLKILQSGAVIKDSTDYSKSCSLDA